MAENSSELPSEMTAQRPNPPDLIVVSDLHLGEGHLPEEHRYSPTEDFFHDDAFSRFLDFLREKHRHDPSSLTLVLNGDTFDFLTVTRVPTALEAERRGFLVSTTERRFGLNPTPAKSLFKLDLIAAGHREFFQALSRFIAAGHRVEILRGNHDLELHYACIQQRILEHLCSFPDGADIESVRDRVRFHEWFYIEPGRVFIEHGNQYDRSNAIRYPLRPILVASRRRKLKEGEDLEMLDYPLGSLFVRFFYNRVRLLDPYAPRLLTFEQYMDFIRRYNLFDIWRVYKDHYPHFAAALGPSTSPTSSRPTQEADAQQEADFAELEASSPSGYLYQHLHRLKGVPPETTKPGLVKEMLRPVLRRFLWFGAFAFVAIFVWLFIFNLIGQIPWRMTVKPIAMTAFMVLSMGALFGTWVHLQRKIRRSMDRRAESFTSQADKIAQFADVPLILMGHTHGVEVRRVKAGRTVYANSGTWTAVNNPWSRLMRDARRLTFLHVQGTSVRLRRWNDDACRVDQVPLFHLGSDPTLDLDPALADFTPTEHSWLPSAALKKEDEEPPSI